MEDITADALCKAGVKYKFDWQYEDGEVKLDFSIPEGDSPEIILEVTQTEARNVLQRKILRYFELVAGVKTKFGPNVAVVSMIYGNPSRDLPAANLQSSLSFFDDSFMPLVDNDLSKADKLLISNLEKEALEHASGTDTCHIAAQKLILNNTGALKVLSKYLKSRLSKVKCSEKLKALWNAEHKRVASSKQSFRKAAIETFYKRGILQALFLKNNTLNTITKLVSSKKEIRTNLFEKSEIDFLVNSKLADEIKDLKGTSLSLSKELNFVLKDKDYKKYISWCEKSLNAEADMVYFFDDIRSSERRIKMAQSYIAAISSGSKVFIKNLSSAAAISNYSGISHSRLWLADFIPFHLKCSQNHLNLQIFSDKRYASSIPNPFNNLVTKSARFKAEPENHKLLMAILFDVWDRMKKESISPEYLADKLLETRLDAAAYLQNFNPLYSIVSEVAKNQNIELTYVGVETLLGDLVSNPHVGRFKVFHGIKNGNDIYVNAVATHDQHDDDKSKEWAARGRVLKYQSRDGKYLTKDKLQMIFVCDGEWRAPFRIRLERAGWKTCSLDEFSDVLSMI